LARLIYTLLFYCLTPVIFLRLLIRSRKAPAYRRRWGERLGFVPTLKGGEVIWVHSVSVGETLAAVPMIKQLQLRNPQAQLVVTTMTPTGSERVKASFGDSVYHVYAPYDMPDAVSRFIRRVKPNKLIIMETELWPNLIAGCRRHNVPVLIANARLSAKSAKGYSKVSALTSSILSNLSCVTAQTIDDGERFKELGLATDKLQVTGNIKFDLDLDQTVRDKATMLRTEWQVENQRPIFLVASTHRGEDEFILAAHKQILHSYPNVLMVLVPRHPERFNEIAELCTKEGFSLARRSQNQAPQVSDQILLGDTMGELLAFCGAADVTFVGGSLVSVGGHNYIEPAAWQTPVLSGPSMFNFAEASKLLIDAGGMKVCSTSEEISTVVCELLGSEQKRKEMGEAAKAVAEQNRGALEKLLTAIDKLT